MAKVTITVDTKTKEMSATVDGEQVEDIVGVSIDKYTVYEGKTEMYVYLYTHKKEIVDDKEISTNVIIRANKNINQEEVNKAIASLLGKRGV